MAKVKCSLPDEFLKKLSTLGSKTDEISEKVLKAGGEVMLDKVKSNLESVVGNDTSNPSESTGELVRSIGLSGVLVDKNGDYNIKVGFREPRSDGKSNAMIANILEYGKHGQPPKPFLKPAKTSSKNKCIEVMTETLVKEIDKI